MASYVLTTFRATLAARIPETDVELLEQAVGQGPDSRELQRALRLINAAIELAGQAAAKVFPYSQSRLEAVPDITGPEQGDLVAGAAIAEGRAHRDEPRLQELCTHLATIGEALGRCDAESSSSHNRPELTEIAENAAAAFVAAEPIIELGGEAICERANEAMSQPGVG